MLLLVCFFFPSLKRHHVPGPVRARGACGRIAEIYGGDIAAEWVRFQVEPPVPAPCDQAFDVEMYCDWWAAQEETYPMLSLATRAIAKMHPTEAACERAFSLLKYAFNRLRSRSREDIVEHTVLGMSAVAFLGGERATRENDSESEDEEKDEEKDKEKDKGSDKVSDDAPLSRPPTLTALPCKLVIDIWQTVAARAVPPEPLYKRPRSETSTRCGQCNNLLKEHSDENNVQCITCKGWFVFECVALSPDMLETVQSADWKCPVCRRMRILVTHTSPSWHKSLRLFLFILSLSAYPISRHTSTNLRHNTYISHRKGPLHEVLCVGVLGQL
jgi:ribosomal protein L12E/L44/L45/RPP1/RPP2